MSQTTPNSAFGINVLQCFCQAVGCAAWLAAWFFVGTWAPNSLSLRVGTSVSAGIHFVHMLALANDCAQLHLLEKQSQGSPSADEADKIELLLRSKFSVASQFLHRFVLLWYMIAIFWVIYMAKWGEMTLIVSGYAVMVVVAIAEQCALYWLSCLVINGLSVRINDLRYHQEAVQSLPTWSFTGSMEELGRSRYDPTCMICLGDFTIGDIMCQMPCDHTFHSDCLQKWLETKCECPVRCPDDLYELFESKRRNMPTAAKAIDVRDSALALDDADLCELGLANVSQTPPAAETPMTRSIDMDENIKRSYSAVLNRMLHIEGSGNEERMRRSGIRSWPVMKSCKCAISTGTSSCMLSSGAGSCTGGGDESTPLIQMNA